MIYLVNLSGGMTSFEALRRALDRHGKDNVRAIFADTSTEDPDLYRFLADQERYFGITIERTKDGRTPWQVMKDEGYITLKGMAPCSNVLKRERIEGIIGGRYQQGEYTRVFGYEWSEIDRMDRLTAAVYPDPAWFPLSEPPYVDKCHIAAFLEKIGIAVPRLYQLGFEHNNCSALCVKAGQAHWAKVYFTLPDRYAYAEAKEEEVRQHLGKNVSILKDRRGGKVCPLTLRAFRERLEANPHDYDKSEWGGCGCFASTPQLRMDDLMLAEGVQA
jgi:3'-phosphoadenosine 5'-phosphosulfate sulfotransferase (PAPS reductase)/FAD synthetase